ncbi:EF-P 5-aminopentanol modification-associated protein YfmF [Massilibacterium senegalense]|uniref:EF-P 5-aminopentanol modification-associated protein YfmF n=1 Tax=Massilibacterium senegalense TaxID=1632858 RepID=UPI000782BE4D|nr:pitrilysin family protein [Massilibacterium senegalense]
MNSTIVQQGNVQLHTLKTKKFKTTTIAIYMQAPLKKETLAMRSILAYILQSGTEKYPSTAAINQHLENLYGATLTADVSKKGDYQILAFRLEIVNEKYLRHASDILNEGLAFLSELILHPLTVNSAFDSKIVQQEKKSMLQKIEGIYDDKMKYAKQRLMEEMFPNNPYGDYLFGTKESVEAISAKELYDYYLTCLQNDRIDLFVVGDVEEEKLPAAIDRYFSFPHSEKRLTVQQNAVMQQGQEEKVVHEQEQVSQGKLNIGLWTNTSIHDADYFALQVYNGILGGFAHSKLFMNVREKASLAYYAASYFESYKGALFILSGIETKNYTQAVKIIKEQLKAIQDGHITGDELYQTKQLLANQLLESTDYPNGLIELYYQILMGGHVSTVDDWIKKIEQVTKEDIQQFAQKVKISTIYFLKGKEGAGK